LSDFSTTNAPSEKLKPAPSNLSAVAAPEVQPTSRNERVYRSLFVVLLALYLITSAITFDQIEEDFFIYLRVAENIADGYGYVFNRGGERVETGSSISWQLLITAQQFFDINHILAVKLIGILLGCLCLNQVHLISKRLISTPALQLLPALWLACTPAFYMWSQRGLETPLYLFSLLWLINVLLDDRYKKYWYVPAISVFFARPEGLAILAALIPFFIAERRHSIILHRGFVCLSGIVFLATLARFIYFQDFVPHPFYSKIVDHSGSGIGQAVRLFAEEFYWLLLIPCLAALFRKSFWRKESVYLLSFLGITFLWGIGRTELKPYNRHLLPFLPVLYLFAVFCIDQFAHRRTLVHCSFFLGLIFAAYNLLYLQTPEPAGKSHLNPVQEYLEYIGSPGNYLHRLQDLAAERDFDATTGKAKIFGEPFRIRSNWQFLIGQYVHDNYPKGTSIVFDQMGQAPWYSGPDMVFIDSWGLTDTNIGYASFSSQLDHKNIVLIGLYRSIRNQLLDYVWGKRNATTSIEGAIDYIFEQKPDVIIISDFIARCDWVNDQRKKCRDNTVGKVAMDPRLRQHYIMSKKIRLTTIYERKDFNRRIGVDRQVARN
jgi:hypothetical protein